jgi:hypothetical protein
VCEEGEEPERCADCGFAEGSSLPLLPIVIGSCYLDAYAASGSCASLPTIVIPDAGNDACFSSLSGSGPSAASIIDLLPSACCAGTTCGGGQTPSLSVGDVVQTVNGTSAAVASVLKDCLARGLGQFVVPIVACDQCPGTTSVLGFTQVILHDVVTQGPLTTVSLTVPCPRCGDGVCTAPDEDCRSCWRDCGKCVPVCD